MFKDKKLRRELVTLGIIDSEGDLKWSAENKYKQLEKVEILMLANNVDLVEMENKRLKQRLDAMMELLGITYEEAHKEPAKLKKGAKSVEVKEKNEIVWNGGLSGAGGIFR